MKFLTTIILCLLCLLGMAQDSIYQAVPDSNLEFVDSLAPDTTTVVNIDATKAESTDSSNIFLWIALAVVAIGAGALLFLMKRRMDVLSARIARRDSEIEQEQQLLKQMTIDNDVLRKEKESLAKKLAELSAASRQQALKQQSQREQAYNKRGLEQEQPEAIIVEAPQPKVVKYADFYLDNGVPTVENRDLGTDPEDGEYKISIQSDEVSATYTINSLKQATIMQDLLALSRYADVLSMPSSPTSIKVEREGRMKRNGACWTVTQKMKVKLF